MKLILVSLIIFVSFTLGNAQTCYLTVPEQPLTAAGLATPYIYENCDMAVMPSFVQASILDATTGTISVYNPLVINKGTTPLAPPVVPTLPVNNVIGIWFGSNANVLVLRNSRAPNLGGSLFQGNCVNGLGNSPFGQFAYCNAVNFFRAAANVTIPLLDKASDGEVCPTTRDFMVVDMDPNDNLQTTYLLLGNRTAQNTAQNTANFQNATVIGNPSDERLLSDNINPALGCKTVVAPDLTNPGFFVSSLALNELQATQQAAPVALLPANDPMVLVNRKPNLAKLNLYRAGINEPKAQNLMEAELAWYCVGLVKTGALRLQLNKGNFLNSPTPDPAVANNLFTFLANRFNGTFTNLGCANIGLANPVRLTVTNGIVTNANFTLA